MVIEISNYILTKFFFGKVKIFYSNKWKKYLKAIIRYLF